MAFRVSFLMEMAADYSGGWTENFWSRAETPTNALAKAKLLRPLLMALHGEQTKNIAIRISPFSGGRRVGGAEFNETDNPFAVSSDSDIPTTRLQLILRNAATYRTLQWLGGIPDGLVVKGKYKAGGPFVGAAEALMSHLTTAANLWGMRVLDADDGFKPIQSISNTGLVTVTAHGYATNEKVLVSGVTDVDDANGTYLITKVNDNSFQLRAFGGTHAGAELGETGRVKRQNYIVTPSISEASIGRASKHNVGRPFKVFSGHQ